MAVQQSAVPKRTWNEELMAPLLLDNQLQTPTNPSEFYRVSRRKQDVDLEQFGPSNGFIIFILLLSRCTVRFASHQGVGLRDDFRDGVGGGVCFVGQRLLLLFTEFGGELHGGSVCA